MSTSVRSILHAIPIPLRPPSDLRQRLLGLAFGLLFNTGCLMIATSQLLFLFPPRLLIALVPIPSIQYLHEAGVRWTKDCFAKLLVLMCQWFAPTRMIVTFEGNTLKEEDVVERGPSGRIVKLNLPERVVMIANHQIYADWLYLWCLTYKSGTHKDVIIMLKDSLKWIPLIGWGMQAFHFIFLARSWASDRFLLAEKLSALATRAQLRANPIALMIFPEGTLVSKDTRPMSKKFADKSGIDDMRHTLLPRSTGLHYSLRSLSPRIPGLQLLDVTIAYQGIPMFGYGQTYYTLRSIFFDGVPPPRIHLHLRLFDVYKDIPIGDLSSTLSHSPVVNGGPDLAPPSHGILSPDTATSAPAGSFKPPNSHVSREQRKKVQDPTPKEAAMFEQWLRQLWREKDALLERHLTTGTFADRPKSDVQRDPKVSIELTTKSVPSDDSAELDIPMELRSNWEILHLLTIFGPALIYVIWMRL